MEVHGITLSTSPEYGGGGIVEALAGGLIVLENNAEVTSQAYVSISAGGLMKTTSGDTADVVTNNLINNGRFNVAPNSTAIIDDTYQSCLTVNRTVCE